MKITITGKNIELTQGIKDAVEDKLSKLDKYFTRDTEAIVTLSVEKDRQKIEVTIPMKGTVIRSDQSSSDMYASIDMVVEAIEKQLLKHRKKIVTKQQAAGAFFANDFIQEDSEEDEIKIVKTKRFGIKPMYPEDACLEMELLGHDFFVFTNAETDDVNVVYKRKNGSYGLIEPEY